MPPLIPAGGLTLGSAGAIRPEQDDDAVARALEFDPRSTPSSPNGSSAGARLATRS
jgi:hypothetical protein